MEFRSRERTQAEQLGPITEPYDGAPECAKSRRIDRPGEHSFRFDGNDLYVECVYCGEYRDALSGRVIRRAF